MFVALRDLRHARGRFVLLSTVVVLLTFLVGFLAALTAGLGRASSSAVADLAADHLAFGMPQPDADPSFTESVVTAAQVQGWAEQAGVSAAQPLGVATTRATGDVTAAVTAFGVEPGSDLLPAGAGALADGDVVLTRAAADALGATDGGTVEVGPLDLTVAAVVDVEAEHSHTPVVWTTLHDWQAVGARGAASADGTGDVATVVALTTTSGADLAGADAALGTTTATRGDALQAIASYAGEHLSLTLVQVFLLAVSALVAGAFFTVWTIQRTPDIATLKALGARTAYLLKDALGQAAVLLVVGIGLGTALAAGASALAAQAMPVVLDASTLLLPAAALLVLGLAGAALAVWRITRVDPHAALAAR